MMTLRIIVFGLGILLLVAQFIMALYEDARKETSNAQLHGTLKEIQQNVQTLVTEGKIAKEDARQILNVTIREGVQLHEELNLEIKRSSDGK